MEGRSVRKLGGNEFQDISEKGPDEQEWRRAQDPEHEWQPTTRCRGKRGIREGAIPPPPTWQQQVLGGISPVQQSAPSAENSFWCDHGAAVSVEIEMPYTRATISRDEQP